MFLIPMPYISHIITFINGILFLEYMNKRTKIIATLSHTVSPSEIQSYIDDGMDAVRINTAHETLEGARTLIKKIRKCSRSISLILDTKGPDIRVLGPEQPITLSKGDILQVSHDAKKKHSTEEHLFVNYAQFAQEVPLKSRIVIDNQQIELVVQKKTNQILTCRVTDGGTLHDNKGVNVPGVRLSAPSLTKRDKTFLKLAVEEDIDYIAHSFVRTKEDLLTLKRSLKRYGKEIPIIAKIEDEQGVQHFSEIVELCQGIMVARGDLGIEIPLEDVPVIQKEMIQRCIQEGKIAITATQMLYSMIQERHPTRAEVSDVANAVYDGSDALMLSGETAYGKYPREALMTMSRIIMNVELHKSYALQFQKATKNDVSSFFANTALLASHDLPLGAIVVTDDSDDITRLISSQRIKTPILAVVSDETRARSLGLWYGIQSILVPAHTNRKSRDPVRSSLQEWPDQDKLLLTIERTSASHHLKTEICTIREFLE